jgi:hypothetical protein
MRSGVAGSMIFGAADAAYFFGICGVSCDVDRSSFCQVANAERTAMAARALSIAM